MIVVLFFIFRMPVSADEIPKQILMITSYHHGDNWDDAIVSGVQEIFSKHAAQITLFIEHLDMRRNDGDEYLQSFSKFLKNKYANINLDLIILSDDAAFNFFTNIRSKFFSNLPIVFCGINNFKSEILASHSNITGVNEEISIGETIEIAFQIFPNTKNIVAVCDDKSIVGKNNLKIFRNAAEKFKDRAVFLEALNLKDTDVPEVLGKLSSDTLIFRLNNLFNSEEQFISIQETMKILSKELSVPIFTAWDFDMGLGALGGVLVSAMEQGRKAAFLSLQILEGTPADHIPIIKESPNIPIVDYQQIKRFGLSLKDLPEGVQVINIPDSLWDRYKYVILFVLSVGFLLMIIVILQTIHLQKRYKIEKTLKASEDEINSIFRSAPVGIGSVVNRVFKKINSRLCEISGYEESELICRSDRMLYPSDTDFEFVGSEKYNQIGEHGTVTVETRWQRKDGSIIDVLLSSTPMDLEDHAKGVTFTALDITERKKTEKALKESEERFKLAMDASRDGVYEWDVDTREIYYSPGWKRMLGYEPDELPDDFSVWENLTRPEDVEKSWQIMNEVVAGKRERFEMEFQMRHKDGHWVHILSRSKLYMDANGNPVRVVGTHVDISENIQQKERLKRSESRYRKAQELGKVGNWEYDLKTEEFWGSDEAKKIYGFDPAKDRFSIEEVESHVLERERVHQAMLDLIENDKPYNLEFDIITKDTGKKKTVISIGELEKDASGNPVKISGVFQDITHRKKAENALENERRFLTAVFDNIEEAIVICDEKGKLIRFNKAAQTLHGLPERPIMPDQWAEYYNLFKTDGKTPLPVEEIPLYRALQGEHVRNTEIVVVPLNSSPRFLMCNGQALSDHTGKTIGAVVAMHDDTERRISEKEREKLQEQLHEVQKMESVGRLAGGVAHDFNNMLGVILGHTELALLQADENHDLYFDLKEIQTAAQRSADITKQLLAFARKQTISPKQLDLNDTVESMLNMLRRLIGENIDLLWQPASNKCLVKMDPSQIDQILANLCINARDAIDGVGKLTIETGIKTFDEEYCKGHHGFIPGNFVLLAVSDNGCGMDKDTLNNLFEPFFTTKEVGKGTGLGLATIYGIVKQNNGFINVYSEPGRGSTFKIYLPRTYTDKNTGKDLPDKKAAAGGTETILLVEDEASILRMTRMMLEKKRYTVLTATTPAEAMEKAKNHSDSIDLLMTDVVMPEMNGRDLAEKITALYPGISLLFMSGYTADVIAHQGVLDDGVAFIQKPFSMVDMAMKVREVLDKTSHETQ